MNNLPQVLVMENVPMVHGEGNKKDFQKWIEFLEAKGYSCWYDDLNAKEYGVAQSRDRCFMVSILGDYHYKFPRPIPLTKKMKDYLEEEVDEKYYINSEKAQELIAKLIESGEIKDGVAWVDKKDIEGVVLKGMISDEMQPEAIKTDVAVTLMARDYKGLNNFGTNGVIEKETKHLGNIFGEEYGTGYAGNVWDKEGLAPTLTNMRGGNRQPMVVEDKTIVRMVLEQSQYRIRKLTPKECWRLMDFSDEDFHKAEQVNSNTQLYKQAGNSIVKNVLVAIFGQMIPGKENVYRERSRY